VSNFWGKAPSSRIVRSQPLQWTGTGTLTSTPFGPETFQIRVETQLGGWIVTDSQASSPTTAGGIGTFISTQVAGEYFTVSPGQTFSYSSTTTSSGPWVSLTECA
jgi:hypothetical protein